MKQPMRTEQAIDKHLCSECRNGGYCGYDCVESETCSFHCTHCKERVWFTGDLHKAPLEFCCPYCGEMVKNKWAASWLKRNGGRK